jgi:hypothetical protein
VLEDPDGPRIYVTATDPGDALRWIAAATLLLPLEQALEVSFKVFAANAIQARHRIVSVPTELNDGLRPGTEGSAFVLDADSEESDSVWISERATCWVTRFLSADDPYDAVDALELAHQLQSSDCNEADLRAAAWSLTVGRANTEEATALANWLAAANEDQLENVGSTAVDLVLAANVPAAVIASLDTVAASKSFATDQAAVRTKLLQAEIASVEMLTSVPDELLINVVSSEKALRDAQSSLTDALLIGDDERVDALLRLARRHGITPPVGPLAGRLRAFVNYWLTAWNHPIDPWSWTLRDEIRDLARDELQHRIAEGTAMVGVSHTRPGRSRRLPRM